MKNAIKSAFSVLKDFDRKPMTAIASDILWIRKNQPGKTVKDYFTNLEYKKNAGNLEDYIDLKTILRVGKHQMNHDLPSTEILEDKIKFSESMTAGGYDTGSYLGKVESGLFYGADQRTYSLETESARDRLMELIDLYGSIFVKQVDLYGGRGVHKMKKGDEVNMELFSNGRRFIIERTLIQHEELNRINPYCINTLRFVTYNDGKSVQIVACLLRLGVNKSFKDNATAGGIFVAYDIQKNELGNVAYRFFKHGGSSFYSHPDSGFVFDKSPLPYPDRVINLVTQAATLFPDKDIIGWDIAYTPEGPVVIEANSNPHVGMTQIVLKGLKNSKIYSSIISSRISR